MPGRRFFDTNILVYALAADDPRSDPAEALVASGGVIGIQVLNEFTSVVRRKLRWPWNQVDKALSPLRIPFILSAARQVPRSSVGQIQLVA
jgi:predicted nucleic acid-binding protein